jgi:hypothetical protein
MALICSFSGVLFLLVLLVSIVDCIECIGPTDRFLSNQNLGVKSIAVDESELFM